MNHLKSLLTHRIVLMFFIFGYICSFALPVKASERFVDNSDGTVTDNKTGLIWVSKDNGVPINWHGATEYCKNLLVGGYSDWRMPTLAELASHFNRSRKNENGYHTIELISTTAQSCWATETFDNHYPNSTYYGLKNFERQRYEKFLEKEKKTRMD